MWNQPSNTLFLSVNRAGAAPLAYLSGPRRARCGRASQLELTTGPQHPRCPPLGVVAVVCSLPPGPAVIWCGGQRWEQFVFTELKHLGPVCLPPIMIYRVKASLGNGLMWKYIRQAAQRSVSPQLVAMPLTLYYLALNWSLQRCSSYWLSAWLKPACSLACSRIS